MKEDRTYIYDIIKLHNRVIGKFDMNDKLIHISTTLDDFYEYNDRLRELHMHDFYMINWIEHGNIKYQVDMEEYCIKNNAILLSSPGEIHSFYSLGPIKGVFVSFTEDYFSCLPENWTHYIKYNIMNNVHFLELNSPKSKTELMQLLSILQREFDNLYEKHNNYMGVYSALTMLLDGISGMKEFKAMPSKIEYAQTPCQELYFSFLKNLETNYCHIHSVLHYAEELRVSVNKLEICCKECCNLRPIEIIENRIILEAKRLLRYTSLRSNEIANMLGFAEQSHFVNFFKKFTQLSPTAFRKKYCYRDVL